MKKLLILFVTTVLLALAISHSQVPKPLEQSLVQLQLKESLPAYAAVLENESLELQAIFLDYRDDPVLLLKAQAALLSQPELTRRILPIYGAEPEFQQILRYYGEAALLPIEYFMNNRIRTLEIRHFLAQQSERLRGRDDDPASELELAEPGSQDDKQLTPEQRGWYAVNFVLNEGHGFLNQFAQDQQGSARWIQSRRFLDGSSAFFTSGIRQLETKAQTGERLRVIDLAWATVDVFVITSTFKLLRVGKAAATGSRATAASRLARIGRGGVQAVKHSPRLTTIAVAFIAVRYPSLINDALAFMANALDLPIRLIQSIGWTLILLPMLYIGSWLLGVFLPLTMLLLKLLSSSLAWLNNKKRAARKIRFAKPSSPALKPSSV